MKSNTHPKYVKSIVKCACGSSFETRSTKPEILIEICSACHPFYSGKKKIIDTTGRVERFKKLMDKKKPKVVKVRKSKKADEKLLEADARSKESEQAAKKAATTEVKK